MFEALRILITGKDREGYKYTGGQRVKIGISIGALVGFVIAIYTAIRRSLGNEIDQILPEPLRSIEYSARLHTREFFEFLANGIYKALISMINNAWMAVAVFGIILLILALRR